MSQVLHFVVFGLIGALLYVLLWAKKWDDLKTFKSLRHMAVGAIIGYVYQTLHTEYNYPDLIMCLVAGYAGPDFIQSLLERLKPRLKCLGPYI